MKILLIAAFIAIIGLPCFAQELDKSSDQALSETTKLLNTPAARNAAIQKDPASRDADRKARDLVGTKENTDEIYGLASEIFKDQTYKAKGDVKTLKAQMEKASSNPEAFENELSPEQLKRIRELASKIERQQAGLLNSNRQ